MFVQGRKTGCRLSLDYTFRDMRVAYLENDVILVGVLVDKGADIFELAYKPRDLDVLWHSPIPLRKPFVATSATPEGAFHDYFYGGWQEVLPAAGWPKGSYLGAFQGLHGEVSLLPFEARIQEDTPDLVTLELEVRLYRSPLRLIKRMSLRRDLAVLYIDERLENEAPVEFAIMWGHHPSFAPPFLDESCVVRTNAAGIEVSAFHRNGLWEPGSGYKIPVCAESAEPQFGGCDQSAAKEHRLGRWHVLQRPHGWLVRTDKRAPQTWYRHGVGCQDFSLSLDVARIRRP